MTEANRKLFRVPSVQLDGTSDQPSDRPKWQHVATAGTYAGYNWGEQPFEFTRRTFEEMVANLRAMPEYHKGPDGVGDKDCVAWDFHHATDAYAADVAVQGAPAQGWVLDLDIRTGADGATQLWALTRWLPTAAQYIRDGAYKWASVSCFLNAVDPKTGKTVGATITSIAITNTPFIQGMQQLAASRLNGGVEAATTPLDAVGKLKELLGLKETDDVGAVMAEVARMRQWLELSSIPLGVDFEGIVGAIRKVLVLPTLTSAASVLDEVSRIAGALLTEQAAVARQQPGTGAAASIEGVDDMELLKTLSKELGVREGDTEVVAAVRDSVALRANMKEALGATKDTTDTLCAEVVQLASDRKGLISLRKALGASTHEDAVSRVAVLLEAEKKLGELEPKHKALAEKLAEQDKAKAEAEVREVLATRRLPEDMMDALLELRLNKPEKFAERFPKLGDRAVLTQPGVAAIQAIPAAAPSAADPGQVIDLTKVPGRNLTFRLKAWIRANEPDMAKADEDKVWRRACELKRTAKVVGQ
jgi:hypothetical protein